MKLTQGYSRWMVYTQQEHAEAWFPWSGQMHNNIDAAEDEAQFYRERYPSARWRAVEFVAVIKEDA